MRVLVTEDDPISALVLEATLQKQGHQVEVTRTGVEALERLRSAEFDVHLLDWMLPELDGIEVVRRVRAEVARPPLVVIVTALAFPEARSHALASGADEFLTKPIRPADVNETIARGLARLRQARPSSAVPRPAVSGGGAPL